MKRFVYSALVIAVTGSAALLILKRPGLITGWVLGVALGLVNFSSLLSNLSKAQAAVNPETTGKFRKNFFIRYLLLAGAFFLIIQLGRDQLGSAVLGFLSLYAVLFIDYFIRVRKKKTGNS